MGSKLITGASGFLGGYLLYRLLRRGETPWVLLRARTLAEARGRLDETLRTYGGCSAAIADDRILLGDICREDLGTAAADRRRVAGRVETVIHAAALPRFHGDGTGRLREINVRGALRAARFAQEMGAREFVHLSTLYVAGQGEEVLSEQIAHPRQPARNPYEASKREAEIALARMLRGKDLRLTVVRPGIVIGEARSGGFPRATSTAHLLSCYWRWAEMRNRSGLSALALDAEDRMALIPVDYFADYMLALLGDPEGLGGVHHIQAPESVSWGWLHETLCEKLGLEGLVIGGRGSGGTIPSALRRYSDYLWSVPATDNRHSVAFAMRHGLHCPRVTADVLDRYLNHHAPGRTDQITLPRVA